MNDWIILTLYLLSHDLTLCLLIHTSISAPVLRDVVDDLYFTYDDFTYAKSFILVLLIAVLNGLILAAAVSLADWRSSEVSSRGPIVLIFQVVRLLIFQIVCSSLFFTFFLNKYVPMTGDSTPWATTLGNSFVFSILQLLSFYLFFWIADLPFWLMLFVLFCLVSFFWGIVRSLFLLFIVALLFIGVLLLSLLW